jgi:tetratricopeptide (TPR) repeat protein
MSYQEGEVTSHEIARPHSPSIDGIAATALAVIAGVLPFVVIPSSAFPFELTKVAIIGLAALAGLACFIVGRMQERRIRLPRSLLFYAVWLLPLAYVLSALFSSNVHLSLFGSEGIATDSAVFIALLALLFAVEVFLVRSKEKILQYYLLILGGGVVLGILQFIRLFVNGFTLGILSDKTSSLLGSWNALALFFGLIAILALITLMSVRIEGALRYFIGGAIVLSLFFLSVIDYSLAWWLVGLSALGVFVYSVSIGGYGKGRVASGMSFSSLIVLAFAIIFIVGGVKLQSAISNGLNIQYVEVRPSWQTTVDIARQTLAHNFLFGSGPSTFDKQWLLYKPAGVNQSSFWNVDFGSGIGFVPSTLATTGLVGILAWLVFFAIFLFTGFKTLLRAGSEDQIAYYLSLSSFIGALYLWVAQIFYSPGPVLLALTFILTGLFVASLRLREGQGSEWMVSFIDTPRLGFVAVLCLTVAFLGSIASIFSVAEVYAASTYYQHSLASLSANGDLDKGSASVVRALSFGTSDEYYRLIAAIDVARINKLTTDQTLTPDQLRTQFQSVLGDAVSASQAAIALDPKDYQNWLTLAQVYQSIVPLKIQGAYENAEKAYQQAITLNPNAPDLYFAEAELAVLNNNMTDAEKFVTQAIQLKNNYTDAIFLLSQIQINEGKIDDAINAVSAAVTIDPTNAVAFFQLGVLRYSKKDYAGTISALEQAVALSPNYANAEYFLGLAYAATNRTADAITQFENIEKTNPDNQEVTTVLANLRAGKPPFPTATGGNVQDLKGLPVPDTTTPNQNPAE